jgi:hypothetical protein
MIDTPTEDEILEARILETITKVDRGSRLLSDLIVSLETARSELRNVILAYKLRCTETEIDALIYAIIKDNALMHRDILFAFDMTEEDYDRCTQRLNERRGK